MVHRKVTSRIHQINILSKDISWEKWCFRIDPSVALKCIVDSYNKNAMTRGSVLQFGNMMEVGLFIGMFEECSPEYCIYI